MDAGANVAPLPSACLLCALCMRACDFLISLMFACGVTLLLASSYHHITSSSHLRRLLFCFIFVCFPSLALFLLLTRHKLSLFAAATGQVLYPHHNPNTRRSALVFIAPDFVSDVHCIALRFPSHSAFLACTDHRLFLPSFGRSLRSPLSLTSLRLPF